MRTLRGGAQYYVKKTIKMHEGSQDLTGLTLNSTHFLSGFRGRSAFSASSIPQILPVSARHKRASAQEQRLFHLPHLALLNSCHLLVDAASAVALATTGKHAREV
jgi:hypothetical protein